MENKPNLPEMNDEEFDKELASAIDKFIGERKIPKDAVPFYLEGWADALKWILGSIFLFGITLFFVTYFFHA